SFDHIIVLPSILASFSSTGSAPPAIYSLSLHDALPILDDGVCAALGDRIAGRDGRGRGCPKFRAAYRAHQCRADRPRPAAGGRKIGRAHVNSSHVKISYAVFCLKKKNKSAH